MNNKKADFIENIAMIFVMMGVTSMILMAVFNNLPCGIASLVFVFTGTALELKSASYRKKDKK